MEFPLRSGAQGGDVQQENGILGGGFHISRGQNFQKEVFLEPRNTCCGTKCDRGSFIQPELGLSISIS